MDIRIEIDGDSGFCFGVTRAITKAEEELARSGALRCLGDIVHNGQEVERLRQQGLCTIDHDTFSLLHHAKVLLRAHGEPPATYATAAANDITLIDATCPVVLQLQKRIHQEYLQERDCQIVIFGKVGHAEVLGLVGQTRGEAIVIDSVSDAGRLDFSRDISLFSQTTQSLSAFDEVVHFIQKHILPPATFRYFDTICRQVANRLPHICSFARQHDVVLFVCGKKSSNGHALFQACQQENPRSHLIDSPQEIKTEWFQKAKSVGICGATSTPKWLMEACREHILRM